MNTTQIKCFLALAETLNFTKAAARLYLTQPGLSRQINSLEQELNTQLFIRDPKRVRLTPAGALLASELGPIQDATEQLVARVRTVGQGFTGELSVGLLEGQWMGDSLSDLFRDFMEAYPNIDLRICQGSFGYLRTQLIAGKIDIAFTLGFDLDGVEGILCEPYGEDTAVFAVSRRLPLGQLEHIMPDDMLRETQLVISAEDSRAGCEMYLAMLRQQRGQAPVKIRYAPNLATLMLWIEMGLGVGIINHQSSLAQNPNIRLIHELPLNDASACMAWRKDNLNPAISLFGEMPGH